MKVSAEKPTPLKATPYPKGFERKFESFTAKMTEAMGKQFNNETIKKLNQGTVSKFDGEKFEDAQTGNWANIFMGLSKTAKQKLKRRYSDDRIDQEVKRILEPLQQNNQKLFYQEMEKATGISMDQLIKQEGLTYDMNALIIETQEWTKKLRDDNIAYFTNNSLRVMSEGASYKELESAFGAEVKNRKNHAKFIARNQIANFNGMSNKIRAQNLGIERAIWQTSEDERVRHSHEVRNGKEYDISKGLYSGSDGKYLQVGQDFNCRCIAMYIIPED